MSTHAIAPAANALSCMGDCIVPHTLTEAATAVGKNRTSILRAIKAGKLSATRDPVSGDWWIEPAELFRLYPPAAHAMAEPANAPLRHADFEAEIRDPRTKLASTEARLADAQDQILDLRQQRDREAEERRRLTAVLADLRTAPPASTVPLIPPIPTRRSWLPWRRRG
jgi:hypothetical protein